MNQLNAVAQQAKEDLGLESDAKIKALADTGYGTGAELSACETNNTETYVPIQKAKGETNGTYTENDFKYDTESDSYECPAGEVLNRAPDRKDGGGFRVYRNPKACKNCPLKEKCTKGKHRQVLVSEHKPAMEAARERLARDPKAMRQRASIVEHPFGTIKDRAGRHELLCKGLELANAEMGLSFWAYNFTRAINIMGAEKLMEAIQNKESQKAA